MIFIFDCHCKSSSSFLDGLTDVFSLSGAEEVTWVKPRSSLTRVFLLTFPTETLPSFIYGERALVKVQPHFNFPLRCCVSQEYGHTARHCTKSSVCGQCSGMYITSTCHSGIALFFIAPGITGSVSINDHVHRVSHLGHERYISFTSVMSTLSRPV